MTLNRFDENETDQPANSAQDMVRNGPLTSQLNSGPSFKPGQPFTFSTGRPMGDAMDDSGIEYVAPLEVPSVEELEHGHSNSAIPLPHRASPYGEHGPAAANRNQQSPSVSFDTGNLGHHRGGSTTHPRINKPQQRDTEFPALFCDEGDCTLGQSHTGVACVWNHCVSTFGEEMAAEMCQGEDCEQTTENILCVDDYCHLIEAEFVGFRGVPCAGGVCGYEAGISICNIDKCTFTSEDGLSFGQGVIDINGVMNPCDEDPILCAGILCACVDPNQHFETDLLGMDH